MARTMVDAAPDLLVRVDRSRHAQAGVLPNGSARGYSTRWQIVLLLADLLAFFASFYAADAIISDSLAWNNYVVLMHTAWLSIGLWIAIFAKLGMYRSSQAVSSRDEIYYIGAALSVGIIPQLILFTLVPEVRISRLLLLVAVGSAILLVGGTRAVIHALVKSVDRGCRRMLVVTFEEICADGLPDRSISTHGTAVPYRSDFAAATGDSPHAILERSNWFRTALEEECDCVVIAGLLKPADATHAISLAGRYGMKLLFAPPELCRSSYDLRLDREGHHITLVPMPLSVLSPPADLTKRWFDLIAASFALVFLSPVLLAVAIAIRLEDGGPAFFKQERVGRYGRKFKVFKFRSMQVASARIDQADVVRHVLTQSGSVAAHLGAAPNDSRVTRVGAFIRKYSLDELAQLINVLRGEMSLVGPRPWMAQYVEEFSKRLPRYGDRHLVRPGITGWAQINMRRNLTTDDTEAVLANDLYYVENWTFLLDLSILFKTAIEFVFNRGTA